MSTNHQTILATPGVQDFPHKPVLARLGTSNVHTGQPHVTPVWFLWDGETINISAFVSTRKVREVARNPLVSILIDTGNPGESVRGILFEGKAELIDKPEYVALLAERIYSRYAGSEGLDDGMRSWIIDPANRIIRLTPEKVFIWG
jgi:PPOX class probable F420-dependent enzyme